MTPMFLIYVYSFVLVNPRLIFNVIFDMGCRKSNWS